MLETIYITRHASRMSETSFRYASPTQTLRDPPLTAHGTQQTRYLAQHLQHKNISAIFCSPFWRCLQTATPVAEALKLPILIEPGLSEWYGRVRPGTGVNPRPPPARILAQHFTLVDATRHTPVLYPPREGERITELQSRAEDVLALLIQRIADTWPDARAVLLITHAATNIALGRALMHDDALRVPSPVSGVARYDRVDGSGSRLGRWNCAYMGDCSFLPAGAERDWAFDHIEEVEEVGVCSAEEAAREDEARSKL